MDALVNKIDGCNECYHTVSNKGRTTILTNIINLQAARRVRRQTKAHGITLCQSGFHKWQTVAGQRFDVKQGKLVTTERCTRCNEERTKLT